MVLSESIFEVGLEGREIIAGGAVDGDWGERWLERKGFEGLATLMEWEMDEGLVFYVEAVEGDEANGDGGT